MFVYQPTFSMLDLKNEKGNEHVISWKSKRLFESNLLPLQGTFLSNIKWSGYEKGIQFNSSYFCLTPLFSYKEAKSVNDYIACDLDYWPNPPLMHFTLEIFLFDATSIVKNSDK